MPKGSWNFNYPFSLELERGEKGFDLVENLFPPMTEIIIEVNVDGYYEAAKTSGPPENCHPAGGNEDRNYSRCYALPNGYKGEEVPICDEIGQQLFDLYQKEINAREIDYENYIE